ncbi:MAG: hypothetical protein J6T99_06100 [Oscillospiraceae bacterium]|nr:hypothetical protein [Oscillospiraceae bacterium]
MKENAYQAGLIKRLESIFPGCFILKNDPGYRQGVPDILVLYRDKWALLECKRSKTSSHRPNQEYYIDILNNMSFASFISPDNEEEVLDGLRTIFGT